MIDMKGIPDILNSLPAVGIFALTVFAFLFVWYRSIERERAQDKMSERLTEHILELLKQSTAQNLKLNTSIEALTEQSQTNVKALKLLIQVSERLVGDVQETSKRHDETLNSFINHQESQTQLLIQSLEDQIKQQGIAVLSSVQTAIEGLKVAIMEPKVENGRLTKIEENLNIVTQKMQEILSIVQQIAQEVKENAEKSTSEQSPLVGTGTGTDFHGRDPSIQPESQ